MQRLVVRDLPYFQKLFETARSRPKAWSNARYPPGCTPERGPVVFHGTPDGSLVVSVEQRDLASDDFGLRLLFAIGFCVFGTPQHLYEFAKGPLSQAFGIQVGKPHPDEPQDLLESVEPRTDSEEGCSSRARDERIRQRPRTRNTETSTRPADVAQPDRVSKLLSKVVKGQDAALKRVAHAVCAQLAKQTPTRPGTILLLGPTGTGKTSTVEALPGALEAAGYVGAHVFRIDCNELTQAFQVSRLIGAPPGYAGYGDSPRLLEALKEPGCIVLLDEIDKADPSIVGDVLLNLIDTGRLRAPTARRSTLLMQ